MASGNKLLYKFYKLASESDDYAGSSDSTADSLQNQETEFVEDTPDTETKSECSDDDQYSQVEFEINSSDEPAAANISTGTDDDLITAGTIAAVLCDSSLSVSDNDDVTDDSVERSELKPVDYWTCVSCKSSNNNPLYRYCQRCFQEKKQSFPPRPRKRKRSKSLAGDKIRAGFSQDSGITSLSECSKRIKESNMQVVRIRRNTSSSIDSPDLSDRSISTTRVNCKRKNNINDVENKKVKLEDSIENKGSLPETKELCSGCNANMKDGIFIHGKTAHLCFCYKCSLRSWKIAKRCPICNRRVNNVVKVFLS